MRGDANAKPPRFAKGSHRAEQSSAQFVTEGSTGSEWAFTRVVHATAAVVGRLPRTELLVVVGDRSVASVVVGTTRFAGRTFVGPWPLSTPLHVLDARGRQLPL